MNNIEEEIKELKVELKELKVELKELKAKITAVDELLGKSDRELNDIFSEENLEENKVEEKYKPFRDLNREGLRKERNDLLKIQDDLLKIQDDFLKIQDDFLKLVLIERQRTTSSSSSQQASFTTPSPAKRSTSKQDSFKNKLKKCRIRSNRIENLCDICGRNGQLEASHIVDASLKVKYEEEAIKNKAYPISVNDHRNGLLLCPTCHCNFDMNPPKITIKCNGKIQIVDKTLRNDIIYKAIHNKVVWWKNNKNCEETDFPCMQLFALRTELKPQKKKRVIEISSDEDDEDEDDEEENDNSNPYKNKESNHTTKGKKNNNKNTIIVKNNKNNNSNKRTKK